MDALLKEYLPEQVGLGAVCVPFELNCTFVQWLLWPSMCSQALSSFMGAALKEQLPEQGWVWGLAVLV